MTIIHENENHAFNHVGVSVPSCDEACKFYMEVFGFQRIRSDRIADRAETPDSPVFKVFDNKLRRVKNARLSCGSSVGFEIFEFQDPPYKQPAPFDYTQGGFFHIAITVPDPEATVVKASELGGRKVGETVSIFGEKIVYLEDPWGNMVECLSCSFDQLMGKTG